MRYSPISGWVQLSSLLTWALLLFLCTPFFHSFISRIQRIPASASWVISKLLGFFFFAWLAVAPASLGLYALSDFWIRIGFLVYAGFGIFFCYREWNRSPDRTAFLKGILQGEFVFGISFFLFLILWAFHPELKTGEKSMNFSFLNFFIRNDHFPPEDPWAAGIRTHYYYFGSFAFALWHRLGAIPSVVGYGLSLATSAGFLGSVSYVCFRKVGFQFWKSVAFSLLVLLAGNVEVLFLYFSDHTPLGYELFWESSRVFSNGRFSEYPLWTYLFGDLHAHNMNLPFGLLSAYLLSEVLDSDGKGKWILPVAFGFIAGTLPIANTWDVFLIVVVAFVALFLNARSILKSYPALILSTAALVLTVLPFLGTLLGGRPTEVYPAVEEWVTWEQAFRFFGFPIALILLNAVLRADWRKLIHWRSLSILLPFLIVSGVRFFMGAHWPWPVDAIGISSGLIFLVLLGAGLFFEKLLILSAAFLILGVDLFSLFDRTITLFKVYFQVSALLWIGALLGFVAASGKIRSKFDRIVKCARFVTVVVSLFAGGLLALSLLRTNKSPLEKPSLDSMGYLPLESPKMSRLLAWIQENIPGQHRVLDAWGAGEMERVTVNVGWPDFAHWEAHTLLRGVPHSELIKRRDLIREFYVTPDPNRAFSILKENGIEYFMVTAIERRIYANENPNLDKFSMNSDYFRLVHQEEGEAIYAPAVR